MTNTPKHVKRPAISIPLDLDQPDIRFSLTSAPSTPISESALLNHKSKELKKHIQQHRFCHVVTGYGKDNVKLTVLEITMDKGLRILSDPALPNTLVIQANKDESFLAFFWCEDDISTQHSGYIPKVISLDESLSMASSPSYCPNTESQALYILHEKDSFIEIPCYTTIGRHQTLIYDEAIATIDSNTLIELIDKYAKIAVCQIFNPDAFTKTNHIDAIDKYINKFEHTLSSTNLEHVIRGQKRLYDINDRFFVSYYDNDFKICFEYLNHHDEIQFKTCSRNGFILNFGDERIAIPSNETEDKINWVPLGNYWLAWSKRRTYEDTIFYPDQLSKEKSKRFHNTWKGFRLTPNPGNCQMVLNHILNFWCNGDKKHYKYTIAWFAHLLQKPWEKPGVALVISGDKGVGKSIIFEKVFKPILGLNHYSKLEKIDQLTGKFNAHFRGKLLVVFEEAFWGGSKAADGPIKSLITDVTTMIEPKGVDAFSEDTFCRVAMCSNENWIVNATRSERRYFILQCSDGKIQDTVYFKTLVDQMDNGGAQALMSHLLTLDISEIDIRTAPKTKGLAGQLRASFSAFEKWIDYSLQEPKGQHGIQWGSASSSAALIDKYNTWYSEESKRNKFIGPQGVSHQTKLTQQFKKIFKCNLVRHETLRALELPDLNLARKRFSEFLKIELDWPDDDFEATDVTTLITVPEATQNEDQQLLKELEDL